MHVTYLRLNADSSHDCVFCCSDFYRFSPPGILPGHPPGLSPHSHPAIVTPGPKQELIQSEINHRFVYCFITL